MYPNVLRKLVLKLSSLLGFYFVLSKVRSVLRNLSRATV